MNPDPNIPTIKDSKIVFDEFFKIRLDHLVNSKSGKSYNYYSLIAPSDAVIILPKTKEGHFVLNKEYRQPPRTYLLSCPGGYLNENESPLEGAARELHEETGFSAKEFILIGEAYPYAGISSQKLYFVLAVDAKKTSSPDLEPGEVMTTKILPLEDVYAYIQKGLPTDGILCTALFYFLMHTKTEK